MNIYLTVLLLISATSLRAQLARPPNADSFTHSSHTLTISPHQILSSDIESAPFKSSLALTPSIGDSFKYNMYGQLRNDDLGLNPKSPWYMPAIKVFGANLFTFSIDRYLLDADFSVIGFNSWSSNLKNGWEWDADRFGMNFFFHPYTGGAYFNCARSL